MHLPLRTTVLLIAASILSGESPCEACGIRVDLGPIQIFPNIASTLPHEETAREFFETVILFEEVARSALTGYRCEQTIGDCSAWSRSDAAEVVVVNLAKSTAAKISRFPPEFGRIAAMGWKDGRELYVRLASDQFFNTIVYLDPATKAVKRVEYRPAELFEKSAR